MTWSGRIATSLLLVVGAVVSLTTIDTAATDLQDDCRIGSVEPERYRAIVAEVAKLPPLPWDEVVAAATSGPNPVLTVYLRRAIEPVADADVRLATLHAALRRGAAAYSWASGTRRGSPPGAAVVATYNYAIDTWDMGLWRPVCRKSVAVVHLIQHASGELELDQAGVVVPSCFKRFGFENPPALSCPPTPEAVIQMKDEY